MNAPALRLIEVDTQTGEYDEHRDHCPQCAYLEDQIAGAEKEIRAWRVRYRNLARDKEAEAREHEMWPQALRIWDAWRKACHHPRCEWDSDRFYLLLPLLKKYGETVCLRAIAGAAYDPWITTRKNGTQQRHDGWELVFRSADKLEAFANRAPLDWTP